MINSMSTSTEHVGVPEWDLADRLGKALRVADMSVNEMAIYLGVHRNTVSAWLNGRTPISGPAIRAWADRTDVDYNWLKTGSQPSGTQPPDGSTVIQTNVEIPRSARLLVVEDDGSLNEAATRQLDPLTKSGPVTLRLTAECSAIELRRTAGASLSHQLAA